MSPKKRLLMVVSSIVELSADTKISREPDQRREPEGAILDGNRFQRTVAHSAFAANKQHARRTELAHDHGVVPCPRRQRPRRRANRFDGALEALDNAGITGI